MKFYKLTIELQFAASDREEAHEKASALLKGVLVYSTSVAAMDWKVEELTKPINGAPTG